MIRVFVSYAHDDEQSTRLAKHLAQELSEDDTLKIVWDHDLLRLGDEWDEKLLSEIDACDGAILLLAPLALTRSYVVKECTLLAQRKRHSEQWGGNTFELLGVLIGGTTVESLGDPAHSHMKDLSLGKYQLGTSGAGDDWDPLLTAIRERMERLKVACARGTPQHAILESIGRQIQTGTPGADKVLAVQLRIDLPAWLVSDASPAVRARVIATEMPKKRLRGVGRALAETRDDFEEDTALKIVEFLATFGVPGDAAAQIPSVAGERNTPYAIEINARDPQTGRWYARLAYGSMLVTQTTQVNPYRGQGVERLRTEIQKAVLDSVQADSIEDAQEELEDMRPPFFVFVPGRRVAGDVVRDLHANFPTVTLVFLPGEEAVQADPDVGSVLLTPLLPAGQEKKSLDAYKRTKIEVKRAHQR
jgi:hypothetical protein